MKSEGKMQAFIQSGAFSSSSNIHIGCDVTHNHPTPTSTSSTDRRRLGVLLLDAIKAESEAEIVAILQKLEENEHESLIMSETDELIPLRYACCAHSHKVVMALLRGLPVATKKRLLGGVDAEGFNCLHLASKHNNVDVLSYLLQSDLVACYSRTPQGDTALHIAAQFNNFGSVMEILNFEDYDYTSLVNERGEQVLHVACKFGHEDVVDLLLNVGVCTNAADLSGGTPFVHALERDDEFIMALLAERNIRNVLPQTFRVWQHVRRLGICHYLKQSYRALNSNYDRFDEDLTNKYWDRSLIVLLLGFLFSIEGEKSLTSYFSVDCCNFVRYIFGSLVMSLFFIYLKPSDIDKYYSNISLYLFIVLFLCATTLQSYKLYRAFDIISYTENTLRKCVSASEETLPQSFSNDTYCEALKFDYSCSLVQDMFADRIMWFLRLNDDVPILLLYLLLTLYVLLIFGVLVIYPLVTTFKWIVRVTSDDVTAGLAFTEFNIFCPLLQNNEDDSDISVANSQVLSTLEEVIDAAEPNLSRTVRMCITTQNTVLKKQEKKLKEMNENVLTNQEKLNCLLFLAAIFTFHFIYSHV